jgi:NIPSNAP
MTDTRYEITTLSCSPLGMDDASKAAHAWIADSFAGRLLGIWHSDIGTVGQLIVLRSFENQADLAGERERALMSTNPFGSAEGGNPLTMESFAPFPFLPPVKDRDYGGTFEFRTYVQKPGGLPGTMDGWRAAIEPAKAYTDHLVVNMYALDGAPRITHIWGFASVAERDRLRQQHYGADLWPPKSGPERIAHATSTIRSIRAGPATPLANSPRLRSSPHRRDAGAVRPLLANDRAATAGRRLGVRDGRTRRRCQGRSPRSFHASVKECHYCAVQAVLPSPPGRKSPSRGMVTFAQYGTFLGNFCLTF